MREISPVSSWGQFLLFENNEKSPMETFQNSSFIKRLAPTETFLNPDYQPAKIRMPTVKKTKHGLKKGDTVTVQNKAPHTTLAVAK